MLNFARFRKLKLGSYHGVWCAEHNDANYAQNITYSWNKKHFTLITETHEMITHCCAQLMAP